MPDATLVVAVDIAGSCVADEQIQRLALVGPLVSAVIAYDDRKVAVCKTGVADGERRPRCDAAAGAVALARAVLVEGVESAALAIAEEAVGLDSGVGLDGSGAEQRRQQKRVFHRDPHK